jgi:hypothetical protein
MQPHSIMAMNSDYSSSPTLFYPAQLPRLDYFTSEQSFQSPLSHWGLSSNNVNTVTKPARPSITCNPSRKRSRDQFDDNEISSIAPADTNGLAAMEVVDEPIYGPGMTLLNPRDGRPISAESQSGTWIEEKDEEDRVAEKAHAEAQRPIIRPTKSCRLESSSCVGQVEVPNTPVSIPSPVPDIDPASAMLGVGWKVVPRDDEDIQQAVRGWGRFIENHYPLREVEIVLKSEGQEAYLVRSQEGWWLFKEDLNEGRLVSTTWEGCVAGLRSSPTVFEGATTLTAQRTPSPTIQSQNMTEVTEIPSGMDLD